MFIQIKDLDTNVEPKNSAVYIIQSHPDKSLYISRSYIDHILGKYTSADPNRALVYFNRHQAEQALNTEFKFAKVEFKILHVPVNADEKAKAKVIDDQKREEKRIRRKQRQAAYEKENNHE